MPDRRCHRGAHPEDGRLFAPAAHEALRRGVRDLSWLLTHGYAGPSALKIVGDRYNLDARQRMAVMRCACSDDALASRLARQVRLADLAGAELLIDGFNVLTTIEVALSGGVLLLARDTTCRDIASIHGSYRKVEETRPALALVGQTLHDNGVRRCAWLLDQPVSNSGRLRGIMMEVAQQNDWDWDVQIVANPDPLLIETEQIVASADSVVIDRCRRWVNLAREVVGRMGVSEKMIDLRDDAAAS